MTTKKETPRPARILPPLPAGTDLAKPCRCGHPRSQHLHARQHCLAQAAQPMHGTCLCVEFQHQP